MTDLSAEAFWDERARHRGALAAGYQNSAMYQYEERLRWAAFLRRCRPVRGIRVLDLGCGPGRWSVRLAELGCSVVGADISGEMLALAAPHPRVDYRQGAAQDLDLPDGAFDLVLSVTVLQHITDTAEFERALDNIRRMLAPGGRVALIEYAPRRAGAGAAAHLVPRTRAEWAAALAARDLDLESETGIRFAGHGLFLLGIAAARLVLRRPAVDDVGEPRGGVARVLRRAGQALDLVLQRIPVVTTLSPVRLLVFVSSGR